MSRGGAETVELAELRARIAALEAAEARRRIGEAGGMALSLVEAPYRLAPWPRGGQGGRPAVGGPSRMGGAALAGGSLGGGRAGVSRCAAALVGLLSGGVGVAVGALVFGSPAPNPSPAARPGGEEAAWTPGGPSGVREADGARALDLRPEPPDVPALKEDARARAACAAATRLASGNNLSLAVAEYRKCDGPAKSAARAAIDAASLRVARTKGCRGRAEVTAAASVGASSGIKKLRSDGCSERPFGEGRN